jgi:hypothetical protein
MFGPSAKFQDPDGEFAEGGHDGGATAGADLTVVFAVGDLTDVMQGLNLPVAPDEGGQFGGPGLVGGQAGDGVDGDGLRAR